MARPACPPHAPSGTTEGGHVLPQNKLLQSLFLKGRWYHKSQRGKDVPADACGVWRIDHDLRRSETDSLGPAFIERRLQDDAAKVAWGIGGFSLLMVLIDMPLFIEANAATRECSKHPC